MLASYLHSISSIQSSQIQYHHLPEELWTPPSIQTTIATQPKSVMPSMEHAFGKPPETIEVCSEAVPLVLLNALQASIGTSTIKSLLLNKYRKLIWLDAIIHGYNLESSVQPDGSPNYQEDQKVVSLSVSLVSPNMMTEKVIFQVPLNLARPKPSAQEASSFVFKLQTYAEMQFKTQHFVAWIPCFIADLNGDTASIHIFENMDTMQKPHNWRLHKVKKEDFRNATCHGVQTFMHNGGLVQKRIQARSNVLSQLTKNYPDLALENERSADFLEMSYNKHRSQIILVGTPAIVTRMALRINECVWECKQLQNTQGRRSKRFKLLAQRIEMHNYNSMIEFKIQKSHIGMIVGRRGKQLGDTAQNLQIELRIFPMNHGTRSVRIYGFDPVNVRKAYMDLKISYQKLNIISPPNFLTKQHLQQVELLAHKSGIFLMWVEKKDNAIVVFGSLRCIKAFTTLFTEFFEYMNRESFS